MTLKFLYYVPYFVYKNIDLNRPHTQIANQFKKLGYKTTLLIGRNDVDKALDFDVIETGVFTLIKSDRGIGKMIREILSAVSKIVDTEPDISIFHGNYSPSAITAMLVKMINIIRRKNSSRLILKLDWDGNLESFNLFGRFSYLLFVFMGSLVFDKITIETPCGYDKISHFPLIRQKLKMIPNTSAHIFFPCQPHLNGIRENIIISVSVLNKNKSVALLISSFYEANKIVPGWKLRIIGPETEPGYQKSLHDLVESYDLKDKIEFLGSKEPMEVREQYLKSSIFCLLSKKESFGITRNEAVASGLPVLTSKAGCADSIRGAIVIDSTSPKEISRHLIELMTNADLRDHLVRSSQKYLVDWEHIVNNFIY